MVPPRKIRPTWTSALGGVLAALLFVGIAHAQVVETAAPPDSPEAAAEAAAVSGDNPGGEAEFVAAPDPEIQRIQALFDQPAQPEPKPENLRPTRSMGIGTLIGQSLVVLLIICGVIILGGAVTKRFLSKTPVLAGARLGQVLGRVYLSPKSSLHYVKTGGRVLVLGVTPTGISLVTEFAAEVFESASGALPIEAKGDTGPNFLEYLTQAQRPARGEGDDDIANLRGEIQRLSEFLREANREPHA